MNDNENDLYIAKVVQGGTRDRHNTYGIIECLKSKQDEW